MNLSLVQNNIFTKTVFRLTTLIAIMLGLAACQTPPLEVKASNSPLADFSAYKTFKVESLNSKKDEIVPIVNNAISQHLSSIGYQPVDSDNADLIIVYELEVDEGQKLKSEAIPVAGNVYTRTTLEAVYEASILVNAFDPKTEEVVWKAATTRDLRTVNQERPIEERAKQSISEIFASFPAK